MILSLVIAVVLTVIFRAVKVPQGADETLPHQYTADADSRLPRPRASASAPRERPGTYPDLEV